MTDPGTFELTGARLQRIDSPEENVLTLTLRQPSCTQTLVFFPLAGRAEVCLLLERPRGNPAHAFAQKCRRTLGNGRLAQVVRRGAREITLHVNRGERSLQLHFNLIGVRARFVLTDDRGSKLAQHGPRENSNKEMTALDEAGEVRLLADTLLECGAELWPRRQQTGFSQLTSRIQKRIRRQQKKVDRKVRAIQADMDRVKECEPLRHEAHLMIANLGAIRPGQTHLLAEDWQQEPPRPVRIELRPELSAQVQAERRFARARKLERGHRLAEHRLRLAEEEMRSLEAAARLVLEVRDAEDLASIIPSLLAAGIREPLGESTPKSRTERTSRQSRKPYRAYRSGDGLLILVGRGGADNDRVTLDHARPHDHWLHARGTPGAHVVIRLTKNQSCPPESLLDAATLAGHFSKLCDEAVVDIQHTSRRHIRKPKGAAAGSVTVEREKVLACRMEPSRIRRLLATEETGV